MPGEVIRACRESAGRVWTRPQESMSNVIDVMIQRLRRKMGDSGRAFAHHHSAQRAGYMFAAVTNTSVEG